MELERLLFEQLHIDNVPPTYHVHAALFRDVTNAKFLHEQLLARNSGFEYAFVDATAIFSRTQLLSAIFRALTGLINGRLATPNVHSEIVLSLSPNNNIADAYRRFGITPGLTQDIIVVKTWGHLSENVAGKPVRLTDDEISKTTDWTKVCKYYKLNDLPVVDAEKDPVARRVMLERLAIMSMALRGV
ncbi:kinase binding protein CGI-121-domain-containing protein [Lasiosphaeria miniovina]|uniref:EKC/KEOPS complex subunit CGI121 n=1 Tax=Lasiosphaeria miniovina TaxID=1954250 RepID=A0AA40EBC0_9PEZI|nr:kinase binding protein CGI-121-domain-containing protein [Lasiosphaeria miniovina]KAK0735274.1 kinase binding protein CGI-121-domain-containing protein [Lasiosphaeria miniovina]